MQENFESSTFYVYHLNLSALILGHLFSTWAKNLSLLVFPLSSAENYYVSLFRREKKSFFNNLDTKKIVDNKRFWETVNSFFSDKNRVKNKITLIEEKTKIVSDNITDWPL